MTKTTYREDFATSVRAIESAMWALFKADDSPPIPFTYGGRTYDLRAIPERTEAIRSLTDDYALSHAEFNDAAMAAYRERGGDGEGPAVVLTDSALLDRLANVLLYEDFTDENPRKMQDAEYPVMSETQLARRREGKHVGKREGVAGREVAFGQSHSVGVDGRNYAAPTRRERSDKENAFIDDAAMARNSDRQRAYNEFTREQPVITYNLYEDDAKAA